MYKELIDNYKVHVGDVAIDDFYKNGTRYIIAKFIENPNLASIFEYTTLQLVSSDMKPQQIQYILNKVNYNKEFLDA